MFLCSSKKTITCLIVFLFTIVSYSQLYNTEVQAKLDVNQDDNYLNIKGIAINKSGNQKSLSYKLSVFKTDQNNNKSKNQQSGQFVVDANQQKDLSTTSINFDKNTKFIILLLIYDANNAIIGKDRVVLNDDGQNSLDIKKDIAKKVNDTSIKVSAQLINNDVEAKIQTNQQNDFTVI